MSFFFLFLFHLLLISSSSYSCAGSEAIYKLLDCFGSLLERVVIRTNFEHKLPTLIDIVEKELDAAKVGYCLLCNLIVWKWVKERVWLRAYILWRVFWVSITHAARIHRVIALKFSTLLNFEQSRIHGIWCVLARTSSFGQKQHFFKISTRVWPTDGRTDRRTDTPSYRDAKTNLKRRENIWTLVHCNICPKL